MKLDIERVAKGVKVEFTRDSGTAPVKVVLDESQVRSIAGILDTALQMKVFKLSIDL